MDLETAYHEAGHAVMAVLLGGTIESLTIAPEQADEIRRYGEITISWPTTSKRQSIRNQVLSALAGPVAEMVISGERRHPGFVPEWKHDWEAAWAGASGIAHSDRDKLAILEGIVVELHQRMSDERVWSIIAAVADHLEAYEFLEDAEVRDIVGNWVEMD